MPYKSRVKSRLYQREYKRRLRGFYNKPESKAVKPNSVKPSVQPSKAREGKHTVRSSSRAELRSDLMVELPGDEALWGFDDSQEPRDDSLRVDLLGGEALWGFDDTKHRK